MGSLSFDRAADYYDQTRSHPPEVSAQIAAALEHVLPSGASLLEVGIGTGRISRPLLAHGFRVSGVDLSRRMMARLKASLPAGSPPPPLAQADATRLPLPAARFDAVLGVHVFHLISAWQEALAEAGRVLRPQGFILIGGDWHDPEGTHRRIRDAWGELLRTRGYETSGLGPHRREIIVAELLQAGYTLVDEWQAAEWQEPYRPAEQIDNLAAGRYSSSWNVPADVLAEAGAELRRWAAANLPDPQKEEPATGKFFWTALRKR